MNKILRVVNIFLLQTMFTFKLQNLTALVRSQNLTLVFIFNIVHVKSYVSYSLYRYCVTLE
jgi:hypothetical protein